MTVSQFCQASGLEDQMPHDMLDGPDLNDEELRVLWDFIALVRRIAAAMPDPLPDTVPRADVPLGQDQSVCLDPNDPTSLVALMELAAKAHPREFPAWWTIVKRELLREGSDDPVPPDTYRKRQKRSVEAPAPSGDGHPTTGSERSGQGGRGGWGGRGGHGGQGGGGGKGGRGGGGGGGKGSRGGGADDRDAYNGDQNESPRDQYPRTGNETSERRPAGPGESNQRSVAADDRGGDDGAEMSSPQCEFRCYRMDMLTAQTCRATRMRTLRRQQLSPQTLQPLRSATSTTTERVSTPADGCITFGA